MGGRKSNANEHIESSTIRIITGEDKHFNMKCLCLLIEIHRNSDTIYKSLMPRECYSGFLRDIKLMISEAKIDHSGMT